MYRKITRNARTGFLAILTTIQIPSYFSDECCVPFFREIHLFSFSEGSKITKTAMVIFGHSKFTVFCNMEGRSNLVFVEKLEVNSCPIIQPRDTRGHDWILHGLLYRPWALSQRAQGSGTVK